MLTGRRQRKAALQFQAAADYDFELSQLSDVEVGVEVLSDDDGRNGDAVVVPPRDPAEFKGPVVVPARPAVDLVPGFLAEAACVVPARFVHAETQTEVCLADFGFLK